MDETNSPAEHAGDDMSKLPARQEQPLKRLVPERNALSLDLLENNRDDEEEKIDLLAYWRVVVKRRRLIAGILAAVVAMALLMTLMTQPMYRASALMNVEKEGPPIIATAGAMPFYDGWDPDYLNTQYELLRSRSLAERVANQMNISEATLARLNDPGWLSRLMGLLRHEPAPKAEADGSGPKRSDDLLKQATGVIQGGLTVSPVRDSRLVRLEFDSPDPGFSMRVVNAVGEAFIASTIERRMGTTTYAKGYLEDQLRQTKGKLEESERNLVEFAQKEGLIDTGAEGQTLAVQNLTGLNAMLSAAQSQRIKAESRWRQVAAGGAVPADMVAASSVGAFKQQLALLQSQYQQKLQMFKPDYPEMLALKSQIEEVNRQIESETGRLRASIKTEFDAAASEESMLRRQIGASRGEALEVDSRSIQFNILKREADTNRQLYDALLQRFKEVGAASDVRTNNISIVDRAEQGVRFKPDLFQNLLMGMLAGLVLGVLAAFALEFLDDTLKTGDDVEQRLRLPVLGIIPKLTAKQNLFQALADPRSAFSEAYRSVRTALQFSTDHGVPRSLLVTSPSPGEGKSTTALSLARNFAQLGKRVLLIEADLRNPSLHKLMGLRADAGLSNLLAGAASMAEVTLDTDDDRLKIILAGPLPPNPAELLSGSKFISLLTVASERYDQVIVDGPPVLGLADSPILANTVEGTLLVVTSGKTKISTAQAALKRLLVARARITGALLTKYDAKVAGYGYYYDSHYAYGDKQRLTRS